MLNMWKALAVTNVVWATYATTRWHNEKNLGVVVKGNLNTQNMQNEKLTSQLEKNELRIIRAKREVEASIHSGAAPGPEMPADKNAPNSSGFSSLALYG